MLSPLFKSDNPALGIYSKQDGIHLRAIARAGSETEARLLIEPMEHDMRRIAGHAIWGEDDDTAVTVALRALVDRRLSLAIVEGFTGGLLSSTLLESPLSTDALAGSVVLAPNGSGVKMFAEVGGSGASPTPEDATGLASAVRGSFDADVGLSVTGLVTEPTQQSGPIGTTHIGIVTGGGSRVRSACYPTRRLRIRGRAVTHTLLELKRVLETGTGGQGSDWG